MTGFGSTSPRRRACNRSEPSAFIAISNSVGTEAARARQIARLPSPLAELRSSGTSADATSSISAPACVEFGPKQRHDHRLSGELALSAALGQAARIAAATAFPLAALGIVGLDVARDENSDGAGWVEIMDMGILVSCAAKPASARSRSAAAPAIFLVRLLQLKPGSGSAASPAGPSLPTNLSRQQDSRRRAAIRQACRAPG